MSNSAGIKRHGNRTVSKVARTVAVAGLAVTMQGPAWAVEVVHFWSSGTSSGNWADASRWTDVVVPLDGTGDPADDVDGTDGNTVVARFAATNAGRTITVDSNRSIAKFWYSWSDFTSPKYQAGRSLTFAGAGALTFTNELGSTPSLVTG